MTLAEYNRLIDLAARAPQPPAPPLPAVLAAADLRVRVDGDTVRGGFNLRGETFRNGADRVRVLSGSTLIGATSPGGRCRCSSTARSSSRSCPGPAPSRSISNGARHWCSRPGRASFALPVPEAGTARATIDLPGDQADVHLSAGLITRRTNANGRTLVEATLVPGKPTEVWWSMRDSAPTVAARELRALADVLTLITIGDSDVRMAAIVDVTVLQGELRTLGLRLPAGYELTGVTGSSLEASEPRDGGLAITVGDPAARRHQFLVSLERSQQGGSFALDTGVVSRPRRPARARRNRHRRRGHARALGARTGRHAPHRRARARLHAAGARPPADARRVPLSDRRTVARRGWRSTSSALPMPASWLPWPTV